MHFASTWIPDCPTGASSIQLGSAMWRLWSTQDPNHPTPWHQLRPPSSRRNPTGQILRLPEIRHHPILETMPTPPTCPCPSSSSTRTSCGQHPSCCRSSFSSSCISNCLHRSSSICCSLQCPIEMRRPTRRSQPSGGQRFPEGRMLLRLTSIAKHLYK